MPRTPARSVLAGRARRASAVLLALLLVPVPASVAMPEPPDPQVPSSTSTVVPATPVTTRVPDRYDRQWPRNPPWDACPRPKWPGERSAGMPGGGRRVLVIGDSLTRDSRVLSTKLMRSAGWTPTFRCWGSRRLDWGIDQVARARQLHQLPEYVILALGTNDISWETPATTERRLRTLLDRLGPKRKVLWVDLHLTRSAWLDARADWFNDLLRRLERQHPNLTVVDWHQMARRHGIHGWDGIHYGPYGFRLRARTVVAALNAEGRRDPVPAATPAPSSPAPTTPVPTEPPATASPSPAGSPVAPGGSTGPESGAASPSSAP